MEGECSDLSAAALVLPHICHPGAWAAHLGLEWQKLTVGTRTVPVFIIFLQGSKYQIVVVHWYLQGSAVSGTAFQAEAMQNDEIGFGSVLNLWEICIWFFAYQTFEPLVSMCDSN